MSDYRPDMMASPATLTNFINGVFVASSGSEAVDVISPSTGELVCRVPLSPPADLDAAVSAAKAAFPGWSVDMTISQRASILSTFQCLVNLHANELADLIVLENGKNKSEALADVAKGNETVNWATYLPELAAGRTLEVSRGVTCQELRSPLGVVGAVVPFNFPLMVPMWTIPISLVSGNCVVLKPSEKVPSTMQRVAELLIEAGVPPGVFSIVHGTAPIVMAMCDHPDIAAVTFVGSSKVAQIVANRCHAVNKRVLALGGAKNHLVALPDCDTGMTSRDVVASAFGCCGQRCMAASCLILVGQHPSLLKEIVDLAAKLSPGTDAGQVGPIIDFASKARVLVHIAESEAAGASVLLDGRSWASRERGNWIGPTILLHQSSQDRAVKEEIFGPVLSVIQVASWEEAVRIENDSPYGNAASIYTERGADAEWFLKRFRSGMLGVNVGIPVPREPFSFGGLYGTASKIGDFDITGDGAMEFFTNRIKVTSKWSASYSTNTMSRAAVAAPVVDKAAFDGKM